MLPCNVKSVKRIARFRRHLKTFLNNINFTFTYPVVWWTVIPLASQPSSWRHPASCQSIPLTTLPIHYILAYQSIWWELNSFIDSKVDQSSYIDAALSFVSTDLGEGQYKLPSYLFVYYAVVAVCLKTNNDNVYCYQVQLVYCRGRLSMDIASWVLLQLVLGWNKYKKENIVELYMCGWKCNYARRHYFFFSRTTYSSTHIVAYILSIHMFCLLTWE